MFYELINPSDPYTFHADDPLVAQAVAIWLGNGKMGLHDEKNGDYHTLLFLMKADAIDEHLRTTFGMEFKVFVMAHRAQIADALDSVMTCGFHDRRIFDEAMKRIDDPVKREEYRALVHDKNRTSMSDFGTYAWKLAASIRQQLAKENP
jgi:hypothetical protein